MKARVPATLDGLVEAARRDVPSSTALQKVAASVALAPRAAHAAPSPMGGAGRGWRHKVAATSLMVGAFCVLGSLVLARSMNDAQPPARSAAAPKAETVEARAIEELDAPGPPTEASIDVRALPESPATPAPPRAPRERRAKDEGEISESALLSRAHGAMAIDPSRALSLTAEHARRFPAGVLAQEREVLAIEALARMGQDGDARARAEAFTTRYPRSAYQQRIDNALRTGRGRP